MCKPPSVSIIIVNWNGLSDTRECLASLSQTTYPNASVLVVNNGSRGDEAGALRAEFPASGHLPIEILETGRNLGFTGGNNLGLRHPRAQQSDYTFLLNNDTVVAPDSVTRLVEALEANEAAGMASAKIFYYDEPERVWFNGGSLLLHAEGVGPDGASRHLPETAHEADTEPFPTEFATACALMVRTSLMQRLKGFDDRFFAYCEDVDLNLYAEEWGLRRLIVPAAHVWHKVSRASGGEASPTILYYCIRNNALLARKHLPKARAAAFIRAYQALHWAWAMGTLCNSQASSQERARAMAAVSAIWCARLNCFRKRQDHVWIEKATAVFSLILAQYMRLYWFLNAHLLDRLRRG